MQWMVDESELRVIHYTLGPLKPWDWWTSWLLKPVDVWQVHSNSFTQLSLWEFSDIIYSFPCVTLLFPFALIRGLEKREKGGLWGGKEIALLCTVQDGLILWFSLLFYVVEED